jgi:hypothetical protein
MTVIDPFGYNRQRLNNTIPVAFKILLVESPFFCALKDKEKRETTTINVDFFTIESILNLFII